MFKVKTYLDKSLIHGTGVFLAEAVKKGDLIWAFDQNFDMQISEKNIQACSSVAREYLSIYCYRSMKTGFYVLCIDDAKYVNHSTKPSTEGVYLSKYHIEGADVALRDLEIGEEITSDYLTFESRRLGWLFTK